MSVKKRGGAEIRADSVEVGGDVVGGDKLIYQLIQEVKTEELTLDELIERVEGHLEFIETRTVYIPRFRRTTEQVRVWKTLQEEVDKLLQAL